MALDHATAAMLAQFAEAGGKPLHESTPEEARALGSALAELSGPAPRMARREDTTVTAADGYEVPVRILVPPQPTRGVIVWLHGGGWVIGAIDECDTLGAKLAERTSCAVVLVDYRLAPEHRYPIAVDDSWAALEWAAANRADLAGNPDAPLIVAGDSAGGNLSAVMALRARDRRPRHRAPGPDLPGHGRRLRAGVVRRRGQPAAADQRGDGLVLGPLRARRRSTRFEPDASPIRATTLEGLPPAVVLTAEHDVLRDEGEAYAEALRAAGVEVDFRRHDGQMHGFFTLLPLPGSERGFQQVVRAVRASTIAHEKAAAAAR